MPVQVADVAVAVNGHDVKILHHHEHEGKQVSWTYYQPKKVIQLVALHCMQSVIGIGHLPSQEFMTFQTKFEIHVCRGEPNVEIDVC